MTSDTPGYEALRPNQRTRRVSRRHHADREQIMSRTTIAFGALLILLGLGAYGYAMTGAQASVTALIPAFLGVPILGLGLAAVRWPHRRGLLIHIAVGLAGLGLLGAGPGLLALPTLIQSPDAVARPLAVVVQSIMAVLCLVYIALAIWSFIAARRRGAPPPAA